MGFRGASRDEVGAEPPSTDGSITVVVAAYDSERFLAAALGSLEAQTRPPEEIIVVDDGSKDSTLDLANRWVARGSLPLRVISTENQGVAAARNVGLMSATTEFVALLDADDLFLPHHLSTLRQALRGGPDLSLCFGDIEVVDLAGRVLLPSFLAGKEIWKVNRQEDGNGFYRLGAGLLTSLLPGSYIPTPANLFRRSAALAVGGFDPSLAGADDHDFWLRLMRQGPFAFTPRVLGRRVVHDINFSALHEDQMALACVRVMRKLLEDQDVRLSAMERSAAQAALNRFYDDALYHTSRRGLRQFWKAWRSAPGARCSPWRHFLRAAVYSFLRGLPG